jgi:copper chaperone
MPKIMVSGISCQHCVDAITKALNEMDGVRDVAVSLDKGYVIFSESKPVELDKVKEVIRKAGFQPK